MGRWVVVLKPWSRDNALSLDNVTYKNPVWPKIKLRILLLTRRMLVWNGTLEDTSSFLLRLWKGQEVRGLAQLRSEQGLVLTSS